MTTEHSILSEFQSNCVDFVDELIELFPAEADLIFLRILIKDSVPPEKIMNGIIKDILPYKDYIKQRDDNFFLKLAETSIPPDRANRIRILWRSSVLDDQDRQVIWKWIDSFVAFADHYQALKLKN
jgi:hypothetical protein